MYGEVFETRRLQLQEDYNQRQETETVHGDVCLKVIVSKNGDSHCLRDTVARLCKVDDVSHGREWSMWSESMEHYVMLLLPPPHPDDRDAVRRTGGGAMSGHLVLFLGHARRAIALRCSLRSCSTTTSRSEPTYMARSATRT